MWMEGGGPALTLDTFNAMRAVISWRTRYAVLLSSLELTYFFCSRSSTSICQEKFPGGLANLIAQLHSDGFKWGHYTDSGKHACNKDAPMSQGYEHQDARLFALEYKADMYV